jgi:hypothetical protein
LSQTDEGLTDDSAGAMHKRDDTDVSRLPSEADPVPAVSSSSVGIDLIDFSSADLDCTATWDDFYSKAPTSYEVSCLIDDEVDNDFCVSDLLPSDCSDTCSETDDDSSAAASIVEHDNPEFCSAYWSELMGIADDAVLLQRVADESDPFSNALHRLPVLLHEQKICRNDFYRRRIRLLWIVLTWMAVPWFRQQTIAICSSICG